MACTREDQCEFGELVRAFARWKCDRRRREYSRWRRV